MFNTKPSGVQSQPMDSGPQRPLSGGLSPIPAPVDRSMVDTSLPFVRVLVGVAFVAYSSYSTILYLAGDVFPVVKETSTWGVFADRYWYGILLAIILFVGETVSAERYPKIYGALLVPDTFYTARGLQSGIATLITAHADINPTAALIVGWVAAFIIGYCIARFGETLLFGKRRR